MLIDCELVYLGRGCFLLIVFYYENVIYIGDIKGLLNYGYGLICMKFLKYIVREQNILKVMGDIVKCDWDYVDRFIYFYEKYQFDVWIDNDM